ncbi:MAG: OmpA/MotB domain protein [Magnetococcales bacterium]|nr:OmpA/MotB domain protein [Magnetococcales bacterium]HIJ85448.1 hypothetical protein [Magnetococcales bacterium]
MKSFTDTMRNHLSPWSVFMTETVSGVLFVIVILLGLSLVQGRPLPLTDKITPSLPVLPTVPPNHGEVTQLTEVLADRILGHEERMFILLERMNEKLETLANPAPQNEFVAAVDRLGQHVARATETMVTAQTRSLEEQSRGRDLLQGIKEQVEHLEGLVSGPYPAPQPSPRSSAPSLPVPSPLETISVAQPDTETNPEILSTAQSRDQFFSQLRASLTRSQLRLFIDSKASSITLPSVLSFDRGSPKPGPRQRRALTVLARELVRILPCHVARPPDLSQCSGKPGAVRVDTIRLRGQAAFARPGEARFFFNRKLAVARARHGLETLLSSQPGLSAMKNRHGQPLFQVEGHVASRQDAPGGQQLDLLFFFEVPDNGDGGPLQSPTDR